MSIHGHEICHNRELTHTHDLDLPHDHEPPGNPALRHTRDLLLATVIEAATRLTQDWENAFTSSICAETRLVADLGYQSLDIVVLTAQLSHQLDRNNIPFERLLLADGKPVSDISLRAVADFLWEHVSAINGSSHP